MYKYDDMKSQLFTEKGQVNFLKCRDKTFELLGLAGAVCMDKLFGVGDAWFYLACLDRMIELGEIHEITDCSVAGQHRVFVRTVDH